MKTQDIRNMGLAYVQVLEESKKKLDPVGKADADIDNDGDTDKSDDYLHNRRKSISAAIKGKGTKETVTTEALVGNQHKIDANKNGKIDSHDFKLLRKGKKVAEDVEELDELSNKTVDSYWKKASSQIKNPKTDLKTYDKRVRGLMTVAMKSEEVEQTDEAVGTAAKYAGKTGVMGDKYSSTDRMMDMKNFNKVRDQRAAQRDAEHQKQDPKTAAAGYAKHIVDTDKARKKAAARGVDASHLNWKHTNSVNRGKLPESTEWPIFARIQEKVNQTKGATKPESMEDRFTASDKKMVDGHGGIGKKTPEDFVNDDAIDKNPNMFNAANVKASPKRHNDQTVGDKTMPKAK